MKENRELEREDIRIDANLEVDCGMGQEIIVYVETWFDVDEKFGIHTRGEEDTWLNLYARYNPFADTLCMECEVSKSDGSFCFAYEPFSSEVQLMKAMITETILEQYGQTPQGFCMDACDGGQKMGGMT